MFSLHLQSPGQLVHLVWVPHHPLPLHVPPDVVLVDEVNPVSQLLQSHTVVPVLVYLVHYQSQSSLCFFWMMFQKIIHFIHQKQFLSVDDVILWCRDDILEWQC